MNKEYNIEKTDRYLTDSVKEGGEAGNQAMTVLIQRYDNFIKKEAYKKRGLSYDEAYTNGVTGLWKAAKKFDPDKDINFLTYARHWIKRETINRGSKAESQLPLLPEDYDPCSSDDQFIKNDLSKDLASSILELSKVERDIINLRFLDDMTLIECSNHMNMAKGTVLKYTKSALDKLKVSMSK